MNNHTIGRQLSRTRAHGLWILCLALLAGNTHAQTEIDEIVVVEVRQAYRGDFSVLEIPQAELDIGEQILDDTNAVDLVSALDLSASVARQNNFGGLWNSFAIRGFVGDENLPSNYLVNGFNAGRGFAGSRDIGGIERVEVLKGPRAALFGRGEPGGTINLVTKRPKFETQGEFKIAAGSFDTYRADIDYTTPLSDQFAVRLVGFYEDAESFRDTIATERYGLFPSLMWRAGENTRLVYEAELTGQKVPFDRGVVAVDNELDVVPLSTFLGEPGNGPMDAKATGHQLELQHDISDNWSTLVGINYRDTSLQGFDTAATLSGSRQFLFRDGENLSRERRSRDYDAKYYVLRGEISGEFETGSIKHRILIGADFDDFENDQVFMRARGGGIQPGEDPTDPIVAERLQVINIFDPVYGQFPLPDPSPLTDRVENQGSFGFFIQDQISLTDSLDVRIGLRFDDYDQELNNRASDTLTKSSESQVSPQFGVVYRVNDDLSLYASYGENFRPLSGSDPQGNPFDPNTTTSVEGGVKFALRDGALQGTASVFHIKQKNILAVTGGFEPVAAGEAESSGFEFDINGQITDSVDFWASYAYVDAKTKNDFNDPNFGVSIPAGTRLLNVPEHQLSLQISKDFSENGLPLRAGGGLVYTGERLGQFGDFFGQPDLGEFELPDYVTLRAYAQYALSESASLRLDIDNLLDEDYYLNSFASLWVQPAAPINWRASFIYQF